MSIAHRATGIALSAGMVFLVWWLVALASGPRAFAQVQWFLSSWLGLLVLFGLTVVAWFKTLAGLRHLYWDFGHGYGLATVMRSGHAVLIATGVLTVLTWVLALAVWR